jgi:hypothetical protein
MRTLFGIGLAIFAVALVITTWSVEPTVGKTPTVSIDPLGLTATTTNLPQAHYQDFSTIYWQITITQGDLPWSGSLPNDQGIFLAALS